jgi:hypothetical protein
MLSTNYLVAKLKQETKYLENKIRKMYSLWYTNIPKVFFMPHNVGLCCTNAFRGNCCVLGHSCTNAIQGHCCSKVSSNNGLMLFLHCHPRAHCSATMGNLAFYITNTVVTQLNTAYTIHPSTPSHLNVILPSVCQSLNWMFSNVFIP